MPKDELKLKSNPSSTITLARVPFWTPGNLLLRDATSNYMCIGTNLKIEILISKVLEILRKNIIIIIPRPKTL